MTQSTVSARIRALEDLLGCRLFVRNKAGTALTPAGAQFQRHDMTLVRTVEQARHDVGIPRGFRGALTVGGRFGLWEGLLLRWLPRMKAVAPDISIRAEIGFEADLMQGLVDGRIDIGVMYTPQSRPFLKVEFLFEEELVLVSSAPDAPDAREAPGPGYVYIDWGPEFYARHSARFPGFSGPGVSANIGWLGLQYLLESPGSGYFPARIVRPFLESGRLRKLAAAPTFSLPAYMVYPTQADAELFAPALEAIRRVATGRHDES